MKSAPTLSVYLILLLLISLSQSFHTHNFDEEGQDSAEASETPEESTPAPAIAASKINREESGPKFEGDIVIEDPAEEDELEHGVMSAGRVGDHYRWPQKMIPYEISRNFTLRNRHRILNGMNDIEKHTCVRFRARISSDKHYIKVETGDGCSSYVGRQSRLGGQSVTLDEDGCMSHGTIMHEFLHALGFWHEQSRTDRDNFVQVLFKNVKPGDAHNFNKYTTKEAHDFGVPYDFSSVMHYRDDAFIIPTARKQGKKTIIPKTQNAEIGQRKQLSKYDILKVNRMYKCTGTTPTRTPATSLRSNFKHSKQSTTSSSTTGTSSLTQDLGSFYIKVSIVKKTP